MNEVRRRRRRKLTRRERIQRKIMRALARAILFACDHKATALAPMVILLGVMVAGAIDLNANEEQREVHQEYEQYIEYDKMIAESMAERDYNIAKYGIGCLHGIYEYPYDQMSQDWGSEDVEGFYYHEISDVCKAVGGQFPTVMQIYTYIVCEKAGVDYEMVFALIEKESRCQWDASGDGGTSKGLMQVAEHWHSERMEQYGVVDLYNPFHNVLVGVDYIAELQEKLKGTVPEEELPYYVLAAYNYGMAGAQEHLWNYGVTRYSYNTEIMERAKQLKEEKGGIQ